MSIFFNHEQLDVFRLSREVAIQAAEVPFPAHHADLRRQVIRASQSVCLNIAEATCRVGRDRNHLFRIAYGSAAETAAGLSLVSFDGSEELFHKLRRVGVMLDRMSTKEVGVWNTTAEPDE